MKIVLQFSLVLAAFFVGWLSRGFYLPSDPNTVKGIGSIDESSIMLEQQALASSVQQASYQPGEQQVLDSVAKGDLAGAVAVLRGGKAGLTQNQLENFGRLLVAHAIELGLDKYDLALDLRWLIGLLKELDPYAPASQFFGVIELSKTEPFIALSSLDELKSYYQEQVSEPQLEHLDGWLLNQVENSFISIRDWPSLTSWYQQLIARTSDPSDVYRRMAAVYARIGRQIESNGALEQLAAYTGLTQEEQELFEENTRAIAKASIARVQLHRSGDHFIAPVVLDGNIPVQLLIDTGASISGLDSSLINDFGLDKTGESVLLATASGQIRSPLVKVKSLTLGSSRVGELKVATLDLGDRYHGLLGMDVLGQYEFYLDQGEAVLYLRPAESGSEGLF